MRKVLVIILFLFSLSPAISLENQKNELNKLFSELKKINNSFSNLNFQIDKLIEKTKITPL